MLSGNELMRRPALRMRARALFPVVLAALIVLGVTSIGFARGPDMASGTVFPFGPNLKASGWSVVSFPGRRPVAFSADGKNGVRVETTGGAGLLWHPVAPGLEGAQSAKWRWQKTEGVGPTDLTRKGGDDRVLALYFAFADKNARNAGKDLKALMRSGQGDILVYVWGGKARPGTIQKLPYFNGRGRTVVKRPANSAAGTWFMETAALATDFKRAFGRSPGKLVAVAVSSDADDTGGRNVAALADLSVK